MVISGPPPLTSACFQSSTTTLYTPPFAEFGIIVVPHPYAVVDWATSIHGSPYAYDREVEMIFMGPGVAPGESTAPAYSVDVAPTLAAMAGIAPVAEIDGKVLDLRAGKQ